MNAPARSDTAESSPASISTTWINLVALIDLALVIALLNYLQIEDTGARILAVFAAIALPVMVLEWMFTSRGLKGAIGGHVTTRADLLRVGIKLVGIAASWLLFLFFYWLFPEFRDGDAAFWSFLQRVWVPVAIVAPFYVWYVDRLDAERNADEYLNFGNLITGRWRHVSRELLVRHARAWLVKLFFLQFIFKALDERLAFIMNADLVAVYSKLDYATFDTTIGLLYLVDVAFAAVAYALTLRLFDTHVRSTEPTLLGWLICLVCYPPFFQGIDVHFIQYNDGLYWDGWLASLPILKFVWGLAIVACVAIYALATVQLGLRFGNLSHRGIVTNGIYRVMKHPAYISKNLSWWLISVPFVSYNGAGEAFRYSVMLGLLSLIYFGRAKTEERHLARDPIYREYLAFMSQHGLEGRIWKLVARLPFGGR